MRWRVFVALFLLVSGFVLPIRVFAATKAANWQPFTPTTNEFAAALVILPKTHQVLYSFKPDTPRVVASLTKLANALVFLKKPGDWNRLVTMKAADEVGGGRLRVATGAKISTKDLFYSSITASANNAAMALARISGYTMKMFVAKMNKTVHELGATHTTLYDASGTDPRNISTAHDLALIAEAAFRSPVVHRAATVVTYPVYVVTEKRIHPIKNTNPLLADGTGVWVVGGKTGYLEESMYNFVGEFKPELADGSPESGKDIIVVVLGAPTKEGQFQTAKRLAQWAWNTHEF